MSPQVVTRLLVKGRGSRRPIQGHIRSQECGLDIAHAPYEVPDDGTRYQTTKQDKSHDIKPSW